MRYWKKETTKKAASEIVAKLILRGKRDMVISLPHQMTDKDLNVLSNILSAYNVNVDFNQLYNEKDNTLTVDRSVLLIEREIVHDN